ncbi:hypothetical protein A9G13_06965 [Gilliamella sp. wkB178]|uniref:hypothetical protein n=1 Tax=Gilliamella sp. wkB178 TaxID=3120259 RepID=UPI00080E99C0|nr:hypothetical protein [Gilliamella apicola]OCG07939.1 hypothetical protein A9G13_06965 [Gilliamella apicola]
MHRLLKSLFLIAFTLFIVSCTYEDFVTIQIDEKRVKFLAKSHFYSVVEPKGNQPRARITVIKVGSDDFNARGLVIYDENNKYDSGHLVPYRFGDRGVVPETSDIHGVSVPDDYLKPLNQINIVPDKPFIFDVSVTRYHEINSAICKWDNTKLFFVPKRDNDYLLSIGIKPLQEKKYLCILRLQEWDKKAKEYKNTPFMLYPEK